jgi:hypothetical protein
MNLGMSKARQIIGLLCLLIGIGWMGTAWIPAIASTNNNGIALGDRLMGLVVAMSGYILCRPEENWIGPARSSKIDSLRCWNMRMLFHIISLAHEDVGCSR